MENTVITENKLQIEFVHDFKHEYVIQTIPFKCGIKITNIGGSPFKGAEIKNIEIKSGERKDILEPILKQFHIGEVNPDEIATIWFGRIGTYMSGLAYIELTLVPDQKDVPLKIFQKNKWTGELLEIKGNSPWLDFFYIKAVDEHTRDKTNSYLGFITFIMAALTIVQVYLAWEQNKYARIQSIPEEINQARAKSNAQNFCKDNPDSTNSGLYYLDGSGKEVPCSEVVLQNK